MADKRDSPEFMMEITGGFRSWKRLGGWTLSMLAVLSIFLLGFTQWDMPTTVTAYIHNRVITAMTTLACFITPLVIFNYAMGDPLHELFIRNTPPDWRDRLNVTLFFSVLALCMAYLISIGA